MSERGVVRFLAEFDATKGELPEGVAVDGDRICVGMMVAPMDIASDWRGVNRLLLR